MESTFGSAACIRTDFGLCFVHTDVLVMFAPSIDFDSSDHWYTENVLVLFVLLPLKNGAIFNCQSLAGTCTEAFKIQERILGRNAEMVSAGIV